MKNIINIVDAPCGYGKTSWAIQAMNEANAETHKFIYITPFLEETKRVKQSVDNRDFYLPGVSKSSKSKTEDLHRLIREERDICMTHALFQQTNNQIRDLIKDKNYTLILDEVLGVVEQKPLEQDSLELLLTADAISIKENKYGIKQIYWNESSGYHNTKYDDIKKWARSGYLMYYDKKTLIWNFPTEIFSGFREVYILTYLFHGQFQRYYYDLHKIDYRYLSVIKEGDGYSLVPYDNRLIHDKATLRDLINIYEGKLNGIGEKPWSLSGTWLKNNKARKQLAKNTYNFLMNIIQARVGNTLWTTYIPSLKSVQPKSYASAFLAVNARATNEYADRYNLAYLVNRFMQPIEMKFFSEHGVLVNQETWALSELIQWVWRSRIRNNESINLYLPSKRMRDLLNKYLSSDVFEEVPPNAITDQYPSDWNFA